MSNFKDSSALLQAIGSTKFRFLDTSGVESTHSPKDREDMQTDDSAADSADFDGKQIARRGHARVLDENGIMVGWAKRNDRPVFDAAEKVLRTAILTANSIIRQCTINVGGGRAVPSQRYADFEAAKMACLQLAANTNQAPEIIAANAILSAQGKENIRMCYDISWHPELTLSDPADIERSERIRKSVAEAIGQVIQACKSGDRIQIRYVLDQVGALAESVSDPKLQTEVKTILDLAESTAQKMADEGKARAAVLRSNAESKRGQEAASRFLNAGKATKEVQTQLTTAINDFEGRWANLEIDSEDRPTGNEMIASEDNRGMLLEIDTEDRPLSPEAIIEIEAIKVNEGFRQLEID